jgi:hypothetical protein
MRAIFPRSLMQRQPKRIVGAKQGCQERNDSLEPAPSSSKEQVDDHQRKNETDATATVVAHSRTHVVAATAEEK